MLRTESSDEWCHGVWMASLATSSQCMRTAEGVPFSSLLHTQSGQEQIMFLFLYFIILLLGF